jgi:hypothetical protein
MAFISKKPWDRNTCPLISIVVGMWKRQFILKFWMVLFSSKKDFLTDSWQVQYSWNRCMYNVCHIWGVKESTFEWLIPVFIKYWWNQQFGCFILSLYLVLVQNDCFNVRGFYFIIGWWIWDPCRKKGEVDMVKFFLPQAAAC